MICRVIFACLCLYIFTENIYSQTTVNPDISAIGDFRSIIHNDASRQFEDKKLQLINPEIELNIGGYLNPYSRGDIIIGWHGEESAEIEEAYATILRGLPLNANIKVGKLLLEFGRLNNVHPHAYSFVKRPLVHDIFFGEEGLSDVALRSSFVLSTGNAYTEIMGGVLKGDLFDAHDHEHEEIEGEEHESEEVRNLGFMGRVTSSFAVSKSAELAIGGTVLNAVHGFSEDTIATPEQLRSWLIGGDIKYKNKPSKYNALQLEAEWIFRQNDRDENLESINSSGLYGYIDYRFRQKYNVGSIFERVQIKELHHDEGALEPEMEEFFTNRFGMFVGYSPFEETSMLRLVGHLTDPEFDDSFWEMTLQFVIGLGPHTPHNF